MTTSSSLTCLALLALVGAASACCMTTEFGEVPGFYERGKRYVAWSSASHSSQRDHDDLIAAAACLSNRTNCEYAAGTYGLRLAGGPRNPGYQDDLTAHECVNQLVGTDAFFQHTTNGFQYIFMAGDSWDALNTAMATGCTTPAPSRTPTTPSPSVPPTATPTATPTITPIVNTVGDCGLHHVACDGQLNSTYQGSGIECTRPPGNPNGRCVCTGPYHCQGTTRDSGRCVNPRNHCFERGITGSPTAIPTSYDPTAHPTSTPTGPPTSSVTTAAPTVTPSVGPTASPSNTPSTPPTKAPSTDVPDPESQGSAGAEASDSGDCGDSGVIVGVNNWVIVGVLVAIIILVVAGTFYVRRNSSGAIDRDGALSGFENSMYGDATLAATRVFMEVTEDPVYMDVAEDLDNP